MSHFAGIRAISALEAYWPDTFKSFRIYPSQMEVSCPFLRKFRVCPIEPGTYQWFFRYVPGRRQRKFRFRATLSGKIRYVRSGHKKVTIASDILKNFAVYPLRGLVAL